MEKEIYNKTNNLTYKKIEYIRSVLSDKKKCKEFANRIIEYLKK